MPELYTKEKRNLITDRHGRQINYLRLAVTDRCNLRCFYCMPHEGLNWAERKDLLTYEELKHISTQLVNAGIDKIRITGGEPFVRKDIMDLLASLSVLNGLEQLSVTTNGVLTAPLIPELKRLGISAVNLSLDTLDRQRFLQITHRDELPAVMNTLEQLLRSEMDVKLNAVVMDGKNTADILPLVALTKKENISVRFIEEMPFNGNGNRHMQLEWDHVRILAEIKQHYPDIYKIPDPPHSTAYNYHIPGHKGTVGIIAAYTRSFCGTCNRIRITPQGMLKTCLYDDGTLNIRDLLRSGVSKYLLTDTILQAIKGKARDGWEAEHNRVAGNLVHESMATIGG